MNVIETTDDDDEQQSEMDDNNDTEDNTTRSSAQAARASRILAAAAYTGLSSQASKEPVSSCEVIVDIDTIDENSSECTGQITISGMGNQMNVVKTFFIGQIIDNSRRHSFQTRGWGARLDHDEDFWSTFDEFPSAWKRKIGYSSFKEDINGTNGIFMRFKECFIKEDDCEKYDTKQRYHQRNSGFINGFYYICMNKQSGEIHGYYFNGDDEAGRIDRQELRLSYVEPSDEDFSMPVYAFM